MPTLPDLAVSAADEPIRNNVCDLIKVPASGGHAAYCFDGIGIGVSGSRALLGAFGSRFSRLPSTSDPASLQITFTSVPSVDAYSVRRPTTEGRPCYLPRSGEVTYFPDEDLLFLSHDDRARSLCSPRQGQCEVSLIEGEPDSVWLATHPLLTIPLLEMLKRRERFSLHAAGVAHQGRCVLFPGTSGAGKSTLTVALMCAGFDFIADDMVFLAQESSGLRVAGPGESLDITDATAALLPRLQAWEGRPKQNGWPKHEVDPRAISMSAAAGRNTPAALIFPRVGEAERSTFTPLGRDEAFLELAPNALLTERQSTRAHLDVLAQLARSVPSFRLQTGRDFDVIAEKVRELLR